MRSGEREFVDRRGAGSNLDIKLYIGALLIVGAAMIAAMILDLVGVL